MYTANELNNNTSYTYFGAIYYDSDLIGRLCLDPNGMCIINSPSKEDYERCNVSEQAQQRFESILHNIEIFSKNENFINAFSLTNSLSKDKIIEYLNYGKGPSITLIEGTDAHANNANNFTLGADILNYLGSIDNSDIEKLGLCAFGVAMVLIDNHINTKCIPFKSGQVIIDNPNPSVDIAFPFSNFPHIQQYNIQKFKYIGLDLLNN